MESNKSIHFGTDIDEEFCRMCKGEKIKYNNDNDNEEDNYIENKNIISLEPEDKNDIPKINKEPEANDDNLLNKKRKPPKTRKEFIAEIKRLMKEGGLEGRYIFTKIKNKAYSSKIVNSFYSKENHPFNKMNCDKIQINTTILYNNSENQINNNSKDLPEINPEKHTQQTNSILEWLQKINIQPIEDIPQKINGKNKLSNDSIYNISCDIVSRKSPYEESNEGIVKFNGVFRERKDINDFLHYIYLREQSEFDPSIKGKIYQWKIHILCNSKLIGVGLADKNVVLNNKNKFLNNVDNFYNGAFCLINTFNKKMNKKEIRPWHCENKNLVNYVATLPEFKKGREITIIYNSNNQSLDFNIKNCSYKMEKVIPLNTKGQCMLTPCAIFYYNGDQVQFGELTIVS